MWVLCAMASRIARPRSLSVAAFASLVGACSASSPDDEPSAADTGSSGGADGEAGPGSSSEDGSSTGTPVDPNAPTYWGDVRPLFIQHCSGCHSEGGIAPYDLEQYATASALAEAVAVLTDARTMPPFNANNDGLCHTFADARWLAQEEIDLLAAWADAGAPEGDPSTPQPDRPPVEQLAGADIRELVTPEGYAPVADGAGEGYDDYQCFLVDPEIVDTARYLVGYEVVPGNAQITHHLIGFLVDPAAASAFGTNGDLMAALDQASPDQPGWNCYGAAGDGVVPIGTPLTWAPGGGAFNFPESTGIRIEPGQVFVVQMHYNLLAGDGQDSTRVRLSWADEVEREAVNALQDRYLSTMFNGAAVEIPPGEEAFVWQWDDRVSGWNPLIGTWDQVEILGLLPHMHELGQRMQVTFFKGPGAEEEECGIYVDRWDFDWQQAFMYETPVILSPTDSIQVTCEWNSTTRDTATLPGLGTQNEMCLLGIYAAQAR
jgi:hypothetical protein